MPSDVDICNTALSYLGDEANVTSINPPDGSTQASYCARYYAQTLNELLEMHTWGFTTVRASLALLANNPTSAWKYAYAAPSGVLNYLAVEDPNVSDDYSTAIPMYNVAPYARDNGLGVYTPQPFVVEANPVDGSDMVLTNQENAVLRYTQPITDTTRFSPLFSDAFARKLAAKLAGPIIRGADGRAEAAAQMQQFQIAFSKAVESDANQRRLDVRPGAPWMVNR